MVEHVDVVVVGAGPVGLLTAIELRLVGAGVLVVERLATPSMVLKAGGIGPLGSEALQRRGMAAAMATAEAHCFAAIKTFMAQTGMDARGPGPRSSGHFAGLQIRRDAQKEPDRRFYLVDQQGVEAMLNERAGSLAIEVRRACEITGFSEYSEGVDVVCASPAGETHIRCAYLVGCDGGRSSIRKRAGFDFPGTDPTLTMCQAEVEIEHPERLLGRAFRHTPSGMFAYGFLPRRLVLLDFSGPPADRSAPVTHAEIEGLLRRISGADVRITAFDNASRWTDHTRLVDTYRKGRIFLAGDAAHIHSPFGGQGLSLGLGDAANLGWKLAAVARGESPESLLDTYTAERRPVAEAVLANTRAQLAIMRPDPQSGAMRDIVAKLMQFDDVNRFFGEMMTGLSIRYDLGSDLDDVGRLIGDRPVRKGETEGSLYDLMQDGRGVLLDASTGRKASALVAASTQKIRCVDVDRGPSLLIRPDACIAWAGEADSTDGLEDALHRWFVPAYDDALVK